MHIGGSTGWRSDCSGDQVKYGRLGLCLTVMLCLTVVGDVWAGEQIVAIQPSAGQTVGTSQPEPCPFDERIGAIAARERAPALGLDIEHRT